MCLFVGNIVSPGVNRQKGGDTTRQHLVVKHESYLLDDVFDLIQKHAPTWSNFSNKMKTQPNSTNINFQRVAKLEENVGLVGETQSQQTLPNPNKMLDQMFSSFPPGLNV